MKFSISLIAAACFIYIRMIVFYYFSVPRLPRLPRMRVADGADGAPEKYI